MHNDDIRLTSGAVLLAALLLATTDSKAASAAKTADFWLESGRQRLKASEYLRSNERYGYAKNVIPFVGDGIEVNRQEKVLTPLSTAYRQD